jgi:GNAT superfamily N-acetyltransferase
VIFTAHHDGYLLSTDKHLLDVPFVHHFLSEHTHWAKGTSRAIVERSIAGSLCFGLYQGRAQVGFGRVITDAATFAYLSDFFVLESHRGQGLMRWMCRAVLTHPDLQGLRRLALYTTYAKGFWEQVGFVANPGQGEWLEIRG